MTLKKIGTAQVSLEANTFLAGINQRQNLYNQIRWAEKIAIICHLQMFFFDEQEIRIKWHGLVRQPNAAMVQDLTQIIVLRMR